MDRIERVVLGWIGDRKSSIGIDRIERVVL